MIRYAITDRQFTPGTERQRIDALLAQVRSLSEQNVPYLQLREKDLDPKALGELADRVVQEAHRWGRMNVLINGDVGLAVSSRADGVHLTSTQLDLPVPAGLLISASCHTLEEVEVAAARKVDAILFGPVFGKQVRGEAVAAGIGLEALQAAAIRANGVPVLALGGITLQNMQACLAAGAAGIAGIRLFQ